MVYSDIGLLLVGFAVEHLSGTTLREAVRKRVTAPLELSTITYGAIPCAMAAPTEFYAHHGRRMCGEVHDENAFAFGGVAGHAGLFGIAHEVTAFGEALRSAGARDCRMRVVGGGRVNTAWRAFTLASAMPAPGRTSRNPSRTTAEPFCYTAHRPATNTSSATTSSMLPVLIARSVSMTAIWARSSCAMLKLRA